jgi:purine-nucleoside phosphorylase
MKSDLLKQLTETVGFIRSKSKVKPKIGVTLGSGLGSFAKQVNIDVELPYKDIPHFMPPTVDGHHGKLILGTVKGIPIAVLQGRVHYYEGHSMDQVVYPTRVIAQLGIEQLILTNAAGGLSPGMRAGDLMIIKDHINLMGGNPLIGPNIAELGLRFPDMTSAYDVEMIRIAQDIMQTSGIRNHIGVYCALSGPTYETPAEIKFLQIIGANAVGMSTVPETIAARHMGVRVFGLSFISNPAAGISPNPITHEEVTLAAKEVEDAFCGFMLAFIERIP